MTNVPLLNPQIEIEVAKAMIASAGRQLRQIEGTLVSKVLDREMYLQNIGAANMLRRLVDELNQIYGAYTNK